MMKIILESDSIVRKGRPTAVALIDSSLNATTSLANFRSESNNFSSNFTFETFYEDEISGKEGKYTPNATIQFPADYTLGNETGSVYPGIKYESNDYIFDRSDVRIVFLVLYTIVFCSCFFGNLMVILVVTLHWRMRSVTNFCLANLAFADLCVGIFCVYQNIITYLMESWVFGEFLCKMYHFINSLSTTASVLILVVISIERYLAIIHPITCKQILTLTRLRMTIVFVWILSAVISSPRFYYFSILSMPLPNAKYEILCLPNRLRYDSKLMDMISMIMLFLIPLAIISILYTHIGIVLWKSSTTTTVVARNSRKSAKSRSSMSSSSGTTYNEFEAATVEKRTQDNCLASQSHPLKTHPVIASDIHRHHSMNCARRSLGATKNSQMSKANLRNENVKKRSTDQNSLRVPNYNSIINQHRNSSINRTTSFISTCSINRSPETNEPTHDDGHIKFQTKKCGESNINTAKHVATSFSFDKNSIPKESQGPGPGNSSVNLPQLLGGEKTGQCVDCIIHCTCTDGNNSLIARNGNQRNGETSVQFSIGSSSGNHPFCSRDSTVKQSNSCKAKCRFFQSEVRHCNKSNSVIRSSSTSRLQTKLRSSKRRAKPAQSNKFGSAALQSRRRVIRMLIVVVLAFAIGHLPFHARKVWQYWSPTWAPYQAGGIFSNLFTPVTFLVMYGNSGINPILYAFMSKKFRTSFKDLLCCNMRRNLRMMNMNRNGDKV